MQLKKYVIEAYYLVILQGDRKVTNIKLKKMYKIWNKLLINEWEQYAAESCTAADI